VFLSPPTCYKAEDLSRFGDTAAQGAVRNSFKYKTDEQGTANAEARKKGGN
jgi:hypothetical protein